MSTYHNDASELEMIIRPAGVGFGISVRELGESLGLVRLLVRRDIVSKYRRTALGPLWYLIQPILMSNVFAIIVHSFGTSFTNRLPPFLFFLCALPIWNYFSRAVEGSASSLFRHGKMLSKVYLPRLVLPVACAIAPLFVLTIQLAFLAICLVVKGAPVTQWIFALPSLVLLTFLFALALGLWFAALSTRLRDLHHILNFALQIGFYVTPILYPSSLVGGRFNAVLKWNPMFIVVEGFRKALLDLGTFDLALLARGYLVAAILMTSGLFVFNRLQGDCVDYL